MKLKYYLRTLGLGIFVTALILTLSGKQSMTDDEVIQRAKQLGMTEAGSLSLADLQEKKETSQETESSQTESSEKKESSVEAGETNESQTQMTEDQTRESLESKESTEAVETNETQETTEAQESTQTSESQQVSREETQTQETASSERSEQQTSSVEESTQESSSAVETGEAVRIVVVGGDTSVSVSKKLFQAGLVADATAYDRFLCQNKYDWYIRVGTFDIPMGSTEEEIAKIITGK